MKIKVEKKVLSSEQEILRWRQTLSLFFGIICIDELLTISPGKVNGKNFDFRVD